MYFPRGGRARIICDGPFVRPFKNFVKIRAAGGIDPASFRIVYKLRPSFCQVHGGFRSDFARASRKWPRGPVRDFLVLVFYTHLNLETYRGLLKPGKLLCHNDVIAS